MSADVRFQHFVESLLAGDRPRCFALVLEWEQDGMDDETLYCDILMPAMSQIGKEWEANSEGIVTEHVATQIVKQILAHRAFHTASSEADGRTAMVGCVPGEHHDIVSTMLANVLERDGWRVLNYGASVPIYDLVQSATAIKPDLLCFTMKSIASLVETETLFRELRSALPSAKFMLGGPAMPGVRAVLSPYCLLYTSPSPRD